MFLITESRNVDMYVDERNVLWFEHQQLSKGQITVDWGHE